MENKQKVLYLSTDLNGEMQHASISPGSKEHTQQEMRIRAISHRTVMSQAHEWCQVVQRCLTKLNPRAKSWCKTEARLYF